MYIVRRNTGILAERDAFVDVVALFVLAALVLSALYYRTPTEAEGVNVPFTTYGEAICPMDYPSPGGLSADHKTFRCLRNF